MKFKDALRDAAWWGKMIITDTMDLEFADLTPPSKRNKTMHGLSELEQNRRPSVELTQDRIK